MSRKNLFANFVAMNLRAKNLVLSFAVTNAERRQEENPALMMSRKYVKGAERNMFKTNTKNPTTVKIASIQLDGRQDVYNMEVLGTHNFAVNGGLIVHNCMDAVRYFVETRRIWRSAGTSRYRSIIG